MEETETLSGPASYPTECHSCGQGFDAAAAMMCSCVVKSRNIVCPHCLNCLCRAPHATRNRFWVDAPEELWERRRAATGRAEYSAGDPDTAEIRPLILVVDDDEDVRIIASGAIRSLGYGVISTPPAEALTLVVRHRPDLILADALMPGVDGRQLCSRVRGMREVGSTPFVIMSAVYKSMRYRAEAMRTFGADAMVTKPLTLAELKRVIEENLPDDHRRD